MSDPKQAEEERIKAWKAERARIAEADKAARIQAKEAAKAEAAQVEQIKRVNAAEQLVAETRQQNQEAYARKKHKGSFGLFLATVGVPVVLTAGYLFAVATPLYEAQSVIAITKSSDTSSGAASGLLGSLQRPANLPEAFRAHSYIKSQALMDSLEAELGLISEFSGSAIDPVRRLRTVPMLSLSKNMQFGRFVESSIDIQSGLLTLYVRAPNEEQAVSVSNAVLRNTEIQVSTLGQKLFDKRQIHASEMRENAEKQVSDAQANLVALQLKYQEVDPKNRVEGIYAKIRELESEALRLNSEIDKAQIEGFGDNARTKKMVELRERVIAQIAEERVQLVGPNDSADTSLNNLVMEYELANLEIELAREAVKSAITAQADAGREAALNRSLFQVVVPPRTAQTAIYPKIPGTLALVFILSLAAFATISMFKSSRH